MGDSGAGQIDGKFRVSESVFKISPGHAGMLSREDFGSHAFAICNGVDDAAVLIR